MCQCPLTVFCDLREEEVLEATDTVSAVEHFLENGTLFIEQILKKISLKEGLILSDSINLLK